MREFRSHRLSVAALVVILFSRFHRPVMAQMKSSRRWCLSSITSRFADQISTRCGRRLPMSGMTPDFGGPHGNGVTQMALIGFDDQSYHRTDRSGKAGRDRRAPTGPSS